MKSIILLLGLSFLLVGAVGCEEEHEHEHGGYGGAYDGYHQDYGHGGYQGYPDYNYHH